ncbi:galactan 5-O-arabinofuranosyltransferase [Corynebacterium uberis]|uniref:galactan 5-O-arabinofuranosyltransferase n=1 Tax=Corynebacterium TaxID=1716 RepID=UPI001D0A11CE|nr:MULTISPECIES: galactan 5-O-arabinofuranosyltransferase [Corynebacterium]MCZ9309871.1 galactan 5-O-arabinofuranosyltransferase [Corynebacterium sp. c6VSa_13]UDL73204.1 galactan 5-O-arabinofuranosyltransferase [Corynebacterium uberis]UDL75919.1 galactan 5-O-arabinofuranosyltransferase [Corynebacterium uberis]UDL78131.1 galactan 5-O-arabinofuranosyltransferase [Corynebacterium uberis]UDL80414.1 galactan 5-O-arabinofuranosyltransferase [Corynebacterium uberis]
MDSATAVHHQTRTDDRLSRAGLLGAMAGAGLGGGAFALVCWLVLKRISLPAFNTSMVTRALATAGSVAVLFLVAGLALWWMRDSANLSRPRWRVWLTHAVAYLAPAGVVITSTGIPLAATRLYTDGLQVDQGFRTQFLTRMATTTSLADMNYADMPTYYPATWFWLGGRLANVLHLPGWEVFQPWALVSLAGACCVLVPVWQRIVGSLPVAAAIAIASTCIVLRLSPQEPYAVIVAVGMPALAVIARRALAGSWFALAGVTVFLGVSATMYTLFTGLAALGVVVLGLAMSWTQRSFGPALRVAVVGVCSGLIALVTWGPYVWATLRGNNHSGATAMHYLPGEGAEVPVPFLSASVVGVLCMAGLAYLIVRFPAPAASAKSDERRVDTTMPPAPGLLAQADARALSVAVLTMYGWIVASMLVTLVGDTLLGFRVEIPVAVALASAGVLGIAHLRTVGFERAYPQQLGRRARGAISTVIVVVMALAAVKYAQDIPTVNQKNIDHAYSDTDGYGQRADRYAPDATQYYAQLDEAIRAHGFEPTSTVVLADETRFMSFYPYLGFQAFTSHYANPLGEFDRRNAAIEDWAQRSWTDLANPKDLVAAMDAAPWRHPDVVLFRGDVSDVTAATAADKDAAAAPGKGTPSSGLKIHIVEDIYPNHPNIRFRGMFFNPQAFADSRLWDVRQVGPFVVAIRT